MAGIGEDARSALAEVARAREEGLAASRATIQACSLATRAVHRHQLPLYDEMVGRADSELRRAQAALAPYPAIAHAGFLHDAEKEYAEARLTAALVAGAVAARGGGAGSAGSGSAGSGSGRQGLAGEAGRGGGSVLPDSSELGIGLVAWLNGLAEAASELRRHLLDRLRAGELSVAEELLGAMEDAYDLLVGIEYPDAMTGGLRRSTDSLRAVLERSRADLTMTLVQSRLQLALERSGPMD